MIKIWTLCALGVSMMALAQEPQPAANFNRDRMAGGARGMFRAQGFRNWLGNHINDQEFLEKAGIKDEQAQIIKTESEKIDAQMKELDEKIEKAALEQAELSRKVLAEPGADIQEVIQIIETISQYRLEQSKLSFQNLVLIRDNLSEEQRKKAQELIMEEGRRRFAERAAAGGMRGGREGAVRGPRGEGEMQGGRGRPGAAGQRGERGAGAPGAARQARPDAPQGW